MSVSLREEIAKMLWVSGNGGSEIGYLTSYQFVKKTGSNYLLADQILSLIGKCATPTFSGEKEKTYPCADCGKLRTKDEGSQMDKVRLRGKLLSHSIAKVSAEIEISVEDLAKQLTNEQWDEIKLIKWQHEKPTEQKEYCSCFDWSNTQAEKDGNRFCPKCMKPIKPIPEEKKTIGLKDAITSIIARSMPFDVAEEYTDKILELFKPEPKPKERIEGTLSSPEILDKIIKEHKSLWKKLAEL